MSKNKFPKPLVESGFISLSSFTNALIPWLLFTFLLLWGWRDWNIFGTLPAYQDALEVPWSVWWLEYTLLDGHGNWLFNPFIFFPEGWHVATFAHRLGGALLLLPFAKLGGLAFAYNVVSILSLIVAFIGMRQLSFRFLTPFAATLAALLFTFWGFRWLRIAGHLHMLLGSTLLPWLLWGLEHSFVSKGRRLYWLGLVGILWAIAISFALYSVWLGGLVIGGWIVARWFSKQIDWRQALSSLLLPSFIAIALNSYSFYAFVQAQRTLDRSLHTIEHLNWWGASLNSLPIPFMFHPWLGSSSQWLYGGGGAEDAVANFGLLAFLLALMAIRPAMQEKAWRPFLVLTVLGIVLALGLTLKWGGASVQIAQLRPLNSLIWQIGHLFKPELFVEGELPDLFAKAIPLPGLLLTGIVPFWEGARTLSRYAFIASVGFFPLVALTISRLPNKWLQWSVAGLLLIEIVPPPLGSVPFPPQTHQAFEWLSEQRLVNEGIIDVVASQPDKLELLMDGQIIWQMTQHLQPTVSGVGSIIPTHTVFLQNWLWEHSHPFLNSRFVPILRSYRVRYLLLHMRQEYETVLQEANQNNALKLVKCFPAPEKQTPWSYPICVYELLSPTISDNASTNLLLDNNDWSQQESWGRWMEGTRADAGWVATSAKNTLLSVEAFPHCDPTRKQSITLEVNNKQLTTYNWTLCDSWQEEFTIPAELIEVGWNKLVIRSSYAVSPFEVTKGENGDKRMLAIGFTKLKID